jgi:hypothetical protein
MLKFINRLEKTRNVVILIFAVLMVVSLVFWGGSGIGGTASVDPARSTEIAASVSGEDRRRCTAGSARAGRIRQTFCSTV